MVRAGERFKMSKVGIRKLFKTGEMLKMFKIFGASWVPDDLALTSLAFPVFKAYSWKRHKTEDVLKMLKLDFRNVHKTWEMFKKS